MSASVLGRFGNSGFLKGGVTSNMLLRAAVKLRPGRGLSASGAQALTSAVEALVPTGMAEKEMPAVVRRAQHHLYTLAPPDRGDLCAFLDLLERLVPLLGGRLERFSRLPLAARRRCLSACERSSLEVLAQGHAALRHLALVAFMEAPEVWPAPLLAG